MTGPARPVFALDVGDSFTVPAGAAIVDATTVNDAGRRYFVAAVAIDPIEPPEPLRPVEVRRLDIRPGDRVVFTYPRLLSEQQRDAIREALKRVGIHRAVILDGGLEIAGILPADADRNG